MFKTVSVVLEMVLKFIGKLLCQVAHQFVKKAWSLNLVNINSGIVVTVESLAPSFSSPMLIYKNEKENTNIQSQN